MTPSENDLKPGDDKTYSKPTFGGGTLARRVISNVQSFGDATFLRYLDADLVPREFTYRYIVAKALVASNLYDQFSVRPGETVVLVISNPKDIFTFVVAALLTGRIPIVSAHPSAKLSVNDFARTLLPVIDSAEPALIVGDPEYCQFLSAAIGRRVASISDVNLSTAVPQIVESTDPTLFVQYSSGTTGTKKGVVISQEQLLWQVDAYADAIQLTPKDHIVSWLPFYHDMGLITALMMPLLTGVRVSLISAFDWVKDPLMLIKAISRDRGTLCWLPNFSYNFLAQATKRQSLTDIDLSSLRGVVNCSEPISHASHTQFMEAFGKHGLRDSALAASYAMAETTFAITSGGIDAPLKTDRVDRKGLKIGEMVQGGDDILISSGKILSGTNVRIIDVEGEKLPDHAVGEIVVSSPSVMRGYHKNLLDTLDAQADGYFRTGDLGYRIGEDLFVTGRVKDLIITAGRNIYPQDLEAIINDIPGVIPGRCVALGVHDDVKGTENVVVLAETELKDAADRQGLTRKIAREVTARFEVALSDVLLVEPSWLKKSTSGKIARNANREKYLGLKTAPAEQDDEVLNPTQTQIRRCVFDLTGSWVSIDAPLITSGLIDSLTLTTLMLELEKVFDRELPLPDQVGFDAYDTISAIENVALSDQLVKSEPFKLVIDRRTKVGYVAESERKFDTLIVGSSRSYMVQARHANTLGCRAFQFAVAGIRAEEYYCITKFMIDAAKAPIKNIVVGLDPTQFAPHLPLDPRFTQTEQLVRYLEEGELEGRNGFDVEDKAFQVDQSRQLSKRIETQYRALDVDAVFSPKTGDITKLWGHHVATLEMLYYDFDESKLTDHFLVAHKCSEFHPRRLYYFKKFLELIGDLDCTLILYMNPLNSKVAKVLGDKTPYAQAHQTLVKWITDIAPENVMFHPFETPKDFKGYDYDYFDGTHMGRHNGERLLEFVLPAR